MKKWQSSEFSNSILQKIQALYYLAWVVQLAKRNGGYDMFEFYISKLKKYKKEMLACLLFSFSFILLDIVIPLLLSSIIKSLQSDNDYERAIRIAVVIIIVSLINSIGTIFLEKFSTKVSTLVTSDIRDELFYKTIHSPQGKQDLNELITRNNLDLLQIKSFTKKVFNTLIITPSIIIISFLCIKNYIVSISFEIILLIVIITFVVFYGLMQIHKGTAKQREQIENINNKTIWVVEGIENVHSFNKSSYEIDEYAKQLNQLKHTNKKMYFWDQFTSPFFETVIIICNVIIYKNYMSMTTEIDSLVYVIEMTDQILFSLVMIYFAITNYTKTSISMHRINEYLLKNQDTSSIDDSIDETNEETANTIEKLIEKGNKRILIIGCETSDDISKMIFNNKHTNNSIEKVSILREKYNIFNTTIKENIFFDHEINATDQEILKITNCEEIIASKEKGIEEKCFNNGANFSGGQRHRIALARTLAKEADTYILCNPWIHLDYSTSNNILNGILENKCNQNIIIFSDRTINPNVFDQIIFMSQNKAINIGSNKELLEHSKEYAEFVYCSK